MFEFDSAEGVLLHLAVNADGERLRVLCSCADYRKDLQCMHLEEVLLEVEDDSESYPERYLDVLNLAESILEDQFGCYETELEQSINAITRASLETNEAECETAAALIEARKEKDPHHRRSEVEDAKEPLREAKEELKECKKTLKDLVSLRVRTLAGLGPTGRSKKSGWIDCPEWTNPSTEAVRGAIDTLYAEALSLAKLNAPKVAPVVKSPRAIERSTAKQGEVPLSGKGCIGCLALLILIVILGNLAD